MVDLHGLSSCFEECQRFLNLYTRSPSLLTRKYAIYHSKQHVPFFWNCPTTRTGTAVTEPTPEP